MKDKQRLREKMTSGERRLGAHANRIADALGRFGVDAVPADCSDGILCVVIMHKGEPDHDARGAVEVDDCAEGPEWEEKLLYEGRQIPCAVAQVAGLESARHERATVLAMMRTAQDADTWL